MSDPNESFREAFGSSPTLVSEAPGRVNLIGEHTDYNELPVFPIALAERVRVWLRPRSDDTVRVGSARFPELWETLRLAEPIEPRPAGDWRNYLRAAAAGVGAVLPPTPRGFDAWITSDLPVASGLSSSSAVVVAIAHALLHLNGRLRPPLEMAALAARAERFVGTQGGGMDQAAAFCGQPGHALFIEFGPLRVRPIAVPGEWTFVVAFTGTPAEKSGQAQLEYNERVASCRRALDRMAEVVGVDRALSYPALLAQGPLPELLALAERVLDVADLARFRHTITEAERVAQAGAAMQARDPEAFGRLMIASHRSLQVDYLVSTDELDHLVSVAMAAGAQGARLTGAGFGGSVVALTAESAVGPVRAALERAVVDDCTRAGGRVFVALPSAGAAVLDAEAATGS